MGPLLNLRPSALVDRPGGSKVDLHEFSMLAGSCAELVVTFHWLKGWAQTAKGKLSSSSICISFCEAKKTGDTGILPGN